MRSGLTTDHFHLRSLLTLTFTRADHVIIQNYEEQSDDHRLYVALFIKDPYRQNIALTNEEFLDALKHHQEELYHDIKHHVSEREREIGRERDDIIDILD